MFVKIQFLFYSSTVWKTKCFFVNINSLFIHLQMQPGSSIVWGHADCVQRAHVQLFDLRSEHFFCHYFKLHSSITLFHIAWYGNETVVKIANMHDYACEYARSVVIFRKYYSWRRSMKLFVTFGRIHDNSNLLYSWKRSLIEHPQRHFYEEQVCEKSLFRYR